MQKSRGSSMHEFSRRPSRLCVRSARPAQCSSYGTPYSVEAAGYCRCRKFQMLILPFPGSVPTACSYEYSYEYAYRSCAVLQTITSTGPAATEVKLQVRRTSPRWRPPKRGFNATSSLNTLPVPGTDCAARGRQWARASPFRQGSPLSIFPTSVAANNLKAPWEVRYHWSVWSVRLSGKWEERPSQPGGGLALRTDLCSVVRL